MNVTNPGLGYYVDRIKSGTPFSFIRLGDGEWSTIMRDRSRTSSGSQDIRLPKLRQGMIKLITNRPGSPNYILALRQTSYRAGIQNWLNENAPDVAWHDCTVFYKASKKGWLFPFIDALRNLEVPLVIVGPERLGKLRGILPVAHHIKIPGKDCFVLRDRILEDCLSIEGPAFFSFTAGPGAKVFIYNLWHRIGKKSFMLDLGSLWDVYVGKRTRRYHKQVKGEILRRNLTGE